MNSIKIILLIGFLPLIISCDNVYISTPQPVDSKNIYLFPREFRGVWTCEENKVIIEKDYFKYAQNSEYKVSKQEIDTSSSYVLKDNKIYIIDNEKWEISDGLPFKLEKDTIYYQLPEVTEIPLGKNAFLRKVKNNYILNIKQKNEWWELVLINKDKNGNIIAVRLDIKDLEKNKKFKNIHIFKSENSRSDYIEANWTKRELLEMINKGVFSDTLFILEPNNIIRC